MKKKKLGRAKLEELNAYYVGRDEDSDISDCRCYWKNPKAFDKCMDGYIDKMIDQDRRKNGKTSDG